MERETVMLEVKSGWKIYQVLAGTVALGAMAYLITELITLREYVGVIGLFLALFFVVGGGIILYAMAYSYKHEIIFDVSGMRRKGIIKEKVIPYSDIHELHFSDSFWQMSPTGRILGNSNAYLIDFKYQKSEEVLAFLKTVLDSERTELVVN